MSARRRPSHVFGTLGTPKLTPVPEELRGKIVAFGARCPTCGDREPKDFLAASEREQFLVRCDGCGHRILFFRPGQG
jgi:DNA-directed RNA polymerase subunit RPC12/RpoP